MGPTQFAKRHKVSRVTIHNWIRKGMIERSETGDINPVTEDPKVWAHKGIDPPRKPGRPPKRRSADPTVAAHGVPLDIDEARLKEVTAKADKARMVADQLAGTLIPVVTVEQEVARSFGALRSRVLGLGDRLAQRLATVDDPQRIRTMIESEARELLALSEAEILG